MVMQQYCLESALASVEVDRKELNYSFYLILLNFSTCPHMQIVILLRFLINNLKWHSANSTIDTDDVPEIISMSSLKSIVCNYYLFLLYF